MSLLRPFSILLRNTLIKQHPYFSCCASCGEIKIPLENRLCTSLSFPYSIDVVLTYGDLSTEEAAASIIKIIPHFQKCCPWASKLFIISKQPLKPFTSQPKGLTITYLQKTDVIAGNLNGSIEGHIHTIPNLSEYYLVAPHTTRLKSKTHPLDFYTPNGIPLLHGAQFLESCFNFSQNQTFQAYTKESVNTFLKFLQKPTQPFYGSSFYSHYAQWTYENGYAILAP